MSLRDLAIDLTPPRLRRALLRWRRRGLRFHGRPGDWREARAVSGGYDERSILERVAAATREVVAGRACFERDSVLFHEPAYPFELLTILLLQALRSGRSVRVLDFGGSLGSTYRQCRPLLGGDVALRWHVVEQEAFMAAGQREFATDELRFAGTLAEACAEGPPDVVLASSVLQYLESPDEVLAQLAALPARFLVIDRTPLTALPQHRLCIQEVPADIYRASYPCWLLSRERLVSSLGDDWSLRCEYDCLDGSWVTDDDLAFSFVGLLLERQNREHTVTGSFRDARVLITGGLGFIGSNLARAPGGRMARRSRSSTA